MRINAADPDNFLTETQALRPDPVYMTLREAIIRGPIGRLFAWLENREERELRKQPTIEPARFSPRPTAAAPDQDDLAA